MISDPVTVPTWTMLTLKSRICVMCIIRMSSLVTSSVREGLLEDGWLKCTLCNSHNYLYLHSSVSHRRAKQLVAQRAFTVDIFYTQITLDNI